MCNHLEGLRENCSSHLILWVKMAVMRAEHPERFEQGADNWNEQIDLELKLRLTQEKNWKKRCPVWWLTLNDDTPVCHGQSLV